MRHLKAIVTAGFIAGLAYAGYTYPIDAQAPDAMYRALGIGLASFLAGILVSRLVRNLDRSEG